MWKTAVKLTFVDQDGVKYEVMALPGKSLLEAVHPNEIDMEGGCKGGLACSICYLYVDQKTFDKHDERDDDEYDMTDLAFALTKESRQGCQIKASKEVEGM